jgi:hypothetical protein
MVVLSGVTKTLRVRNATLVTSSDTPSN